MSFVVPATPLAARRVRRDVLAFVREHTADPVLQAKVARVLHAALEPAACEITVAADVDDGCLELVLVKHGTVPERVVADCADAFAVREPMPGAVELWMRFDLGSAT